LSPTHLTKETEREKEGSYCEFHVNTFISQTFRFIAKFSLIVLEILQAEAGMLLCSGDVILVSIRASPAGRRNSIVKTDRLHPFATLRMVEMTARPFASRVSLAARCN
jgi:hypothetical protein